MSEPTPLDRAHAEMEAAPEDDAARLRFYERLADSELFLMLTTGARDENLSPEIFDLADGTFVLVFDREDRLATFAGRAVPYAALSGRIIAQMLAGQGVGLGVNLEVAPSSILIPAEAMGWLQQTLGNTPDQVEDRIAEFTAPAGLPESLLSALDAKLATATGLAESAYLVGVTYRSGGLGHMLGIIGARPGAEQALAKAVGEALTFSGIEAGSLDVAFYDASDDMVAKLSRVGLRFDLPQPKVPVAASPKPPGSDPDKPPVLR